MIGEQLDFYNTVGLLGERKREARRSATSQQRKILDYFAAYPTSGFTPFEIQEAVLPEAPITSVRRAITNLTNLGRLQKTVLVEERFGLPNHRWRFRQ